ncbi:hypothetical protein PspKH34_12980 [Parageobacillus sp. KH3-4]|nr:hypothetical protein PspKH34_12980 [Parageobacillus sp. KH3-4]
MAKSNRKEKSNERFSMKLERFKKNYVIITPLYFVRIFGDKGDYIEKHHEKNYDAKRTNRTISSPFLFVSAYINKADR